MPCSAALSLLVGLGILIVLGICSVALTVLTLEMFLDTWSRR